MIALSRNMSVDRDAELVQERFLEMLPLIRQQALAAFRNLRVEARADLTQEVIARAYSAFVRLVQRGKSSLAYPTPLALYAIRQVRACRRVGCQQNINDVLSPYARRRREFAVERLDGFDERTGAWRQSLVEDRRAGPAETAAARLDLAAWFGKLTARNRKIARALALGEPTCVVARRFGLTSGRVSQLRNWFRAHWEQFQAETQPNGTAA
jgi:DNA-binding NarL/FixJ family response regulator